MCAAPVAAERLVEMLSSRTPEIRAGAARLVGLVAQHTFAVRVSRDADPFRPFDLLVTGTYSIYLLCFTGTQFTCFTGTRDADPFRPLRLLVTGTQFTCFTGATVQILTHTL